MHHADVESAATEYMAALQESWERGAPIVPPLQAVLSVASRCDSRCRYCDAWRPGSPPEPSLADIARVVGEMADLGVERLNLSGGEPLLRDDLEEIVSGATESGLAVGLLTNGRTLTPSRLNGLRSAGLRFVSLSVDSLDHQRYLRLRGVTPAGAYAALESLAEMQTASPGFKATVLAVLSRDNLDDIEELVTECERLGLFFQMQPVQGFSLRHQAYLAGEGLALTEEDAPTLAKVVRRVGDSPISIGSHDYLSGMVDRLAGGYRETPPCYAGYAILNVDVRLDVRPCWPMPAVGSLYESRLAEIWHSDAFADARQRMRRRDCIGCHLICHAERVRSLAWLSEPKA